MNEDSSFGLCCSSINATSKYSNLKKAKKKSDSGTFSYKKQERHTHKAIFLKGQQLINSDKKNLVKSINKRKGSHLRLLHSLNAANSITFQDHTTDYARIVQASSQKLGNTNIIHIEIRWILWADLNACLENKRTRQVKTKSAITLKK